MPEVQWILWAQAGIVLLVGWLLIFVPAWVFPYAWRGVGLVAGILWGAAPFVVDLWRRLLGEPNLLAMLWDVFGLPLELGVAGLGVGPGPLHGALTFILGLALGYGAAWTGNYFRLFR